MEIIFALRNLLKRLFLNLIKIAGLSFALTGITLILLFIKIELSYDQFHLKSDRIFRFTVTNPLMPEEKHFARVSSPDYIPAMADYFPEIESYVRLIPIRGGVIRYSDRYYRINEAFQCDSTFFEVFNADLLSGNKDKILDNKGIMVITKSFAKRIFGERDPVGQTMTLPAGQFYGRDTDFTIRGIMKDFPQNSHFHPEFIVTPVDTEEYKGWAWTYLLLHPGSNTDQITKVFKKFYSLHSSTDTGLLAHLQNIRHIHLHSDKLREIEPNGNTFVIFTLTAAALILLFIALTNFANLNLAMAVYSDRYLQISKIFGASNRIKFYLTEGLIILLFSVILSIIFSWLANLLLQKYFSLNLLKGNALFNLSIIVCFGVLCILSVFLIPVKHKMDEMQSGWLMSNRVQLHRKGISKSLIVIQYVISTALVVSVIVMIRQTDYALKTGMGDNAGELICIEDVHSDIQLKFGIFKQELLKHNSVKSVTGILDPPGGEANDMFAFEMEGYRNNGEENDNKTIGILPCDYSFVEVFNLKFLSGKDFSPANIDNEGSGEYIINRSALKRLGFRNSEEIIGKSFKLLFHDQSIQLPSGKITGVVEDFHISGIKKKVEPLVLFKRSEYWLNNIVISVEPGYEERSISDIKQVWQRMFPEHPFDYRTVKNMYHLVYKAELLQTRLLSLFTIVALFVCSIGLLGLSLLTTQRRTKEIGIRMVHGASIREILVMLNWYFIQWIVLSFVIAIPL
ncbi:MAG TPA: ABC transporter permease, partial [Bacteroidales bacterium]|nr:ABC transporter permease [Bacteroidales bacterium]